MSLSEGTLTSYFPNNVLDSKYYNLYNSTMNASEFCNGICYGHALSETSRWWSDNYPENGFSNKIILRGGSYGGIESTGIFNFNNVSGNNTYLWTTRVIFTVK